MLQQQDESITRYASYLLRLRLVWGEEQPSWMASLENTATGTYRSFPDVESLAAFLLAEFGGHQRGAPDGVPYEVPPTGD